MKRPILVSFAICMALFAAYGRDNITERQVEESLDQLDDALSHRDTYIDMRHARIDSLKHLLSLAEPSKHARLMLEIGDAYGSFRNDSAVWYYTYQGVDPDAVKPLLLMRSATYLPLLGLVDEALETFDSIDRNALPDSLVAQYHEAGRQMYSYIASTYSQAPEHSAAFAQKSALHRDSLLLTLPSDSPLYALNYGERLMQAGEYESAYGILANLLTRITPDSNLYARACHMLATIALRQGRSEEAKYYLAKSAIADVRGAVLEVMSLQELGVMLADGRDISRAYDYLSIALQNAVECHAMMRIVQSSESLPLIQQTHQQQADASRRKIVSFMILLIVAIVVLIVVLIILRRQMAKMRDLQQRLHNANSVKEVYISQFFRLCSIYIDRLNQFCQLANRKITAGKVDELYKITKSGRFIEEQSEEFYRIFDDAFLHIFPTFVDDLNALMREKIELKENELLNNELRILAFMRLGLDDTNKVAIMLNYSVNTIYTYRNKLRNRAINRETFEEDIMKIKGY